ncbi:hypothetical protein Tcan_11708 [Toxocara canis]|uniref:Uncharacterized protein n=1 Tax=Toxocara canis TaxID=6265 RepID=A0A0B2UWK2_TOXCA|nr:hypothetical protein Tcan_11708 [Toxocara canis]
MEQRRRYFIEEMDLQTNKYEFHDLCLERGFQQRGAVKLEASCDVQKLLSIVGVSRAQISRDTVPMSADCNGTVASASTVLSTLHNIPPKGTHRSSVTKQQCPIKANLAVGQISPYPSSKQRSSPKPLYDVFLGGSCGNTVWRRDQVIPYLEKRAITYYDPQRSVWNEHMINEESVAKENSSLFLFVLDPATVNATSFLEIAHFAARKAPKLVVVFLGRTEWRDRGHPQDLPDRRRTCDLLDTILIRVCFCSYSTRRP